MHFLGHPVYQRCLSDLFRMRFSRGTHFHVLTMLSRLAGSDQEQDRESTSNQETFTLIMKVCEVELLIRPTEGLVSPQKNLIDKHFL